MSDDFDYDDGNDFEGDEPAEQREPKTPNWRRKLEQTARTASEERDALRRENAFLKAGVNPEDGKAKWLVKGYDGELTSEAIKQAAIEAGVLAAPEPVEDDADVIPAGERAAHERIAAASTGATPTGAFDFNSAIAEARSQGNHQRAIELKQAQSAAARNGR